MMQINRYYCICFLLCTLHSNLFADADFWVEVNGSPADTLELLDSTKPVSVKIGGKKTWNCSAIHVTHCRKKRAIKTINVYPTIINNEAVKLSFPKIMKHDGIYVSIKYIIDQEATVREFERWVTIGETPESLANPYYLEIRVLDQEKLSDSIHSIVSLVKNWKEIQVRKHQEYTKGESFTNDVKEGRYYFNQMPDSLKMEIRYGSHYTDYRLPIDYLKYGGCITIHIIRDVKAFKKKYKEELAEYDFMSPFYQVHPYVDRLMIGDSLIYVDYERFPLGNGTSLSSSRPMFLNKMERKKGVDYSKKTDE